MSVSIVNAMEEDVWSAFTEHRYGSLFSSRPWASALAQTYGFPIEAIVRSRGGDPDGAILFSRISDARGARIVSLPFSDYGDPLIDDAETWDEAVRPLLGLSAPVTLRCLHNALPAGDPRFSLVNKALWHGIDLSHPEQTLWAGFKGSARQNIRKARRLGVVVHERSDLDAVRTFHDMHCHVRKTKYRLLAQPVAFFEALHAAFALQGGITVLLAEAGGTPVAGSLFIRWRDTLYYKFNASLDPRWYANDLIAWEGVRFGQRCGLSMFDFGLSSASQSGLVRFKRKFASEEKYISFLRYQPPGLANAPGEDLGRTFDQVTALFTDPQVPDDVTRAAGAALYRFFC